MRKADIERVFKEVAWNAHRLGLVPDGHTLALSEGSPVDGIAWGVSLIHKETRKKQEGGVRFLPDSGKLGQSKREAYEILRTANTVMLSVWNTKES